MFDHHAPSPLVISNSLFVIILSPLVLDLLTHWNHCHISSNIEDIQSVSTATLKITSQCWYVNNNFFDVSTNISNTIIGKVPISTTKSTYTLDITEVVKSNQLSTLKLRPYASSTAYETTIELFEVSVEVMIEDGTGVNSLYLGNTSVDKVFLGNDVVDSIYKLFTPEIGRAHV